MSGGFALALLSCYFAAVAVYLVQRPAPAAGAPAAGRRSAAGGRRRSPRRQAGEAEEAPTVGWTGAGGGGERPDLVEAHPLLVSALAGSAPLWLVGGPAGVVVGLVAGVLVWRTVTRREPAALRRRRRQVAQLLPHAVDLLAVTLRAGASPSWALSVVAGSIAEPLATDLHEAEHALRWGRDPARVWREVAHRPGLGPLGRAMARAVDTGAPVGETLRRLATELHEQARLEGEARARTVGSRAAAPLGLCLLPAFVLVGVVPLVVGATSSLLAG